MNRYPSIKELVSDLVTKRKGLIDYKTVTSQVKTALPTSKWDKTHWAWHPTLIVNGRFRNQWGLDALYYHSLRKVYSASE